MNELFSMPNNVSNLAYKRYELQLYGESMETNSLVRILNVFYMFQKPILSEKPDSAFRWDSKGKKDEYEHRQLQVILSFYS